jgi:TPR repeat protein
MFCGCKNIRSYSPEVVLLLAMSIGFEGQAMELSASPIDVPKSEPSAEGRLTQKEIEMGDAYFTGHGVSQDLKLAAYWYEKAAGFGDPLAQNQIGYFYQTGLGVPSDPARAVHWYQLAAAGGLTRAKVNLGVAYFWGMGVEKDRKTAEQLFIEAANSGDSMARTYLGDMYFFGDGIQQDKGAGERLYENAVKMHNYWAAYRLGTILSQPSAHPKDLARALSLLREAAAAGFVPAMHSAGLLLVNNPALCISHEEALSLLKQSASAGMWKSSVVLGTLARDGKWTPQDSRMAYFHFRVGVLQGGAAARALLKNDLDILSKKIRAEELAKIDEEANAWTQKHSRPLEVLFKDGTEGPGMVAFALAIPPPGEHAGPLIPLAPF